eukprot:CAMPEP_0113490078 /NCGR_PEP_ID=MMETSP0014_2-20120614/26858_1 /TAXON_ID=2857 /ORGANISM="Nitzschia sp." /LENGTH=646 /DNA_ID=CAMNT_0000383833 /DNA_START=232 /DNA_END=2172 /DNA_ORIENTATION=- /assembly_acc=CAM_ASM_000159
MTPRSNNSSSMAMKQQQQNHHHQPPRSPSSSTTPRKSSSSLSSSSSSSSSFGWGFGGGKKKKKNKSKLRILTNTGSGGSGSTGSTASTSGRGGGLGSPALSVASSSSSTSSSVSSLGRGRMLKCGSVTFEPSPTGRNMVMMNKDYATNDSIAVTPRSSFAAAAATTSSSSSSSTTTTPTAAGAGAGEGSFKSTHSDMTETTLVSSPNKKDKKTHARSTTTTPSSSSSSPSSSTTTVSNSNKKKTKSPSLLLSPSPSSPSSPSPSSPSRPPPPAAVAAAVVVSKFFERSAFSFLRVADLEIHETMTTTVSSSATSSDEVVVAVENEQQQQPSQEQSLDGYQPIDHIHHASVDPPPGVDHDPKERWIAFTTDKDGSHAPIAPIAMDRLAHFGLTTSLNQAMWTPADYKTSGLIKKGQQAAASGASAGGSHSHQECSWYASTFRPGPIKQCPALESNDVMIWSGSFIHGLYGSDLPAIRAAGIVNMSAKSLFDLLVDSTRVKEYNKLSLGRTDLVTFDGDLDTTGPFGRTITKVMRSETKPPMIRKTLVFESILHAKELVDGSGYLIVTRAIHQPGDDSSDHHHSLSSVIKSEILMGVNLIRKVEGQEDSRCLMINVNHIRSPMVPMMVAKRIGVSSAVGFMNDIRALC